MIVDVKRLNLWGCDVVIRAKAKSPHVVFDSLKNEACFYYLLNGYSDLYTPTHKTFIPKQEGVSLQCGNYIGKFFTSIPNTAAEILIVKFPKDILKRIYINDLPSLFDKIKKNKTKEVKVIQDSSLLNEYVKSLLFYTENPHLAIEELLVLKIRELFILLANSDEFDTLQQVIESLFGEVDFNFRKIIEQHYYSNLKLDALAHLCMMSLSTFKRKFQTEFGQPPHQFLAQKKLARAMELIKNTPMQMVEIAEKCGFPEYSNFSNAFKKTYKQSPSHFRSRH